MNARLLMSASKCPYGRQAFGGFKIEEFSKFLKLKSPFGFKMWTSFTDCEADLREFCEGIHPERIRILLLPVALLK